MRIKRKTLLELAVATIVLLLLAAIFIPKFIQSQSRTKIANIKHDFRAIMAVLVRYRADYPEIQSDMHAIRNRFLFPRNGEPPKDPQLFRGGKYYGKIGGVMSAVLIGNVPAFRQNLIESGYLKPEPPYYFRQETANEAIFLLANHTLSTDPTQSKMEMALVYLWPMPESYEVANPAIEAYGSKNEEIALDSFVDDKYLFDITNGVDSKGLIVVDSLSDLE